MPIWWQHRSKSKRAWTFFIYFYWLCSLWKSAHMKLAQKWQTLHYRWGEAIKSMNNVCRDPPLQTSTKNIYKFSPIRQSFFYPPNVSLCFKPEPETYILGATEQLHSLPTLYLILFIAAQWVLQGGGTKSVNMCLFTGLEIPFHNLRHVYIAMFSGTPSKDVLKRPNINLTEICPPCSIAADNLERFSRSSRVLGSLLCSSLFRSPHRI